MNEETKKRNIEYRTLSSGRTLAVPIFNEETITVGYRRKTRHLSEEEAGEEILWLLLEKNCTAEELEVWDTLTTAELEEIFKEGETPKG